MRSRWIIGVVLMMAGCGGSPAAECPAGASTNGAEVEAFLAQVAARRCQAALRCVADDVQRSQNLVSEAHCVDRVLGHLRSQAIPSAVSAGSVCFVPGGVSACLAAVEREACGERVSLESETPWPSACRGVISGTLADGSACALDEECQSLDCNCGACAAPFVPMDLSCSAQPCPGGYVCNSESTCVPYGQIGEACGDAFGVREGTCAPNLFCVDGTCRAPEDYRTAGDGEPCYSPRNADDPLVFCAEGFACEFERAGEGVCRPLLAVGEPCGGGSHGICAEGSFCHGPSDDLRCRAFAAEGEECFPSGAGDPCEVGTVCQAGESRCVAVQEVGGACRSDMECYGYCNDGTCGREPTTFCR
jgi:hypothetical protein